MDDAKEYLEIKNAMDIVGISQEEQVLDKCISASRSNEAVV